MMRLAEISQTLPQAPHACFFCGRIFEDPASIWVWLGANEERLHIHGGCVVWCGMALQLDRTDLNDRPRTQKVYS